MSAALARLCASHGIEPTYVDAAGLERSIGEDTLAALAEIFGVEKPAAKPPAGVAEALAETKPKTCHVPRALSKARVWGLTCQLPSLASERNLGMGDFADLLSLCRIVAEEGGDFVGLNPLHALFWSDPGRVSPFSPSNRRYLNPLYLALDWIEGFEGLPPEARQEAARLRQKPLVDFPAVARLKGRLLRALHATFPWSREATKDFEHFCTAGGDGLWAHALFETLSESMVAKGQGAGWLAWPKVCRDRGAPEVAAFVAENEADIAYHLWLQWLTDRQLARVQREARRAGLRVGLYLDCAVGAAADGSATWSDPNLMLSSLSIGAPPDAFSVAGQDWGLSPLSPLRLAKLKGRPFAETLGTVLRHGGAARIDHAMSLTRLWLIPRGMPAAKGAYVRYPLPQLLDKMAEASQEARTIVIGEDLGVVPQGFREVMAARRFHSYRIFYFEFDPKTLCDREAWPADALACVATHDMPTFAGWWEGGDLLLRESLGMLSNKDLGREQEARESGRQALLKLLGGEGDAAVLSPKLHAFIAASPCRLVALQIEDALGDREQTNLPGTIDEHPNWRRRLPVALEQFAGHPGFRAHTAALRRARPR